MTTTLFLKFADESEAISVLADYRKEDQWVESSETHGLYPLGTLYTVTPTDDPENPLVTPMDGYHVNMRVLNEIPEYLESYRVYPVTPRVI
jgi:hypothetical protein